MTLANLTPDETPTWFKMYSFKEAYGVSSLEPVELDRLAHRMANDSSIMQQYFEFYNLLGDPKLEQGCDQDCYDNLLCSIVRTDTSTNSTRCDDLLGGPSF
jgi:sphingomyelin phosphodiesterase